jgi:hypothetical protein
MACYENSLREAAAEVAVYISVEQAERPSSLIALSFDIFINSFRAVQLVTCFSFPDKPEVAVPSSLESLLASSALVCSIYSVILGSGHFSCMPGTMN